MDHTWQYYDLLLAGIAASMLIGAVIGLLSSVSLAVASTAGATFAAGLIGYGMFVNGPVESPTDLAEPVETLN